MDIRRLLIAGLAFGVGAVLARQLLTECVPPGRRPVVVPAVHAVAAPRPPAPQVDAAGRAEVDALVADDAQTAAAFRPAVAAAGDHADARLVPIRKLQQPRRRARGRLDAREPTETAARLELPAADERAAAAAYPAGYEDDDRTAAAGSDESDPDAPEDDADANAAAVARGALFFVGADPAAEAVWADAINDPGRAAHERSDLIEGLNHEGFADPANPTPDDLPLIERRLALIEALAPDAMDEVNAAAFAEAYEHLVNMHARASGQ